MSDYAAVHGHTARRQESQKCSVGGQQKLTHISQHAKSQKRSVGGQQNPHSGILWGGGSHSCPRFFSARYHS